ncbi:MAG: glycosyltransferase [Alphaproteobacteria bacterium]|nr:glycosyltransferase [Alphaproteobacteria bacterium]
MTRLFQAIAGGKQGGAENFFVRLAVAFARAGLEQRVAIRRNAARAAALRAGGVEPIELGFGGWLDFATRPALARAIGAFRPDVVMTWMSRATALCPAADATRPFVHVGRLGGYYDLKYYRRCDHLVGNTEDIVEHIVAAGWPRERAHYLPNFVDAAPAAEPVPRAAFGTPGQAAVLLALGRLHVNKGFDVLLRALATLPDAVLWLAGAGPEEAALKRLAHELGLGERVRFLGWRDDVAALFAAADVFVCPSRHEPLGNVVIEAWAHGVPVVAAAAQGPAALVRGGVSGLLVPVDDAPALAAAISRALGDADLRRALVAAGRRAYEADFTEAAVVARYRAFFDRITEGR